MAIVLQPGQEFVLELAFSRPVSRADLVAALSRMGFGSLLVDLTSDPSIGAITLPSPTKTVHLANPSLLRSAVIPAPVTKTAPQAAVVAPQNVKTVEMAVKPNYTAVSQAPPFDLNVHLPSPAPAPAPGGLGPLPMGVDGSIFRHPPAPAPPKTIDLGPMAGGPKPSPSPLPPIPAAGDGGAPAPGPAPAPSDAGGGAPAPATGDGAPPPDEGAAAPPPDALPPGAMPMTGPPSTATSEGTPTPPYDDLALFTLAKSLSTEKTVSLSGAAPMRIRFVGVPTRPIELTNTDFGAWTLAWPLHVSATAPVVVENRDTSLAQGGVYEIRFLSPSSSANAVRAALETIGFDFQQGPFLLRRHIYHPAMRGAELTDWLARGTWRQRDARFPYGGAGKLLFEQIARV